MKACFWGVRGSIATPGRDTVRFGGNTVCVSVTVGARCLILDAGTGLRRLGEMLAESAQPLDLDLLLSHAHLDHIAGLPFFRPLFQSGTTLRVWAGQTESVEDPETRVRAVLTPPLMPDMASLIQARVSWRGVGPEATLDLGDGISVRTAALDHPGGSIAFRIEWRGRILVYATDTGHGDPEADAALRALCLGADVLIYDAMLLDEEFPGRTDWGHSTWRAGIRLADDASVRRLVLFHHAPWRHDRALAALVAEAAAVRPGTIAAREGLQLTIRRGR
jgi:phosphoribosyl 1,2-cyclic phosphodiesterase